MSLLQRLSRDLDISTRQVERRLERRPPPGFRRAGRRGHWRAKGPITPARIGRIKVLWGMDSGQGRERRRRRIERFIRRLEANLFADRALTNGYNFAEAKLEARRLISLIAALPTTEQLQQAVQAVKLYLRNRNQYAEAADERLAASLLSFGGENAEKRGHLETEAGAMQYARRNRDKVRLESAVIDLARLGVSKVTRRRLAEQMQMPERTFYASFTSRMVEQAIERAYAKQTSSENAPLEELVRALVALERKGTGSAKVAPDSDEALADYLELTAEQFAEQYGEHADEARRVFDGLMWGEQCKEGIDSDGLSNLSHRFTQDF